MWRIGLSRWDVPEHWEAAGDKLVNALERGRLAALQAALDDKLLIWGKREGSDLWEKIEPGFWTEHTVETFDALSGRNNLSDVWNAL